MPIAVEQVIYLLERQMAAVRIWGIYLRIAQNYYENLKKNYYYQITAKPKLIYTPTASLLPSLLWTLILCDMTKIWRKQKRKEKRKEKERKRKKTYEATLQTQIWINRGVGNRWAVYGLSGRAQPPQFFYYLVKEKWSSKYFPFPKTNVLSFNRYYI